jgi:anaerobic selenocysteine-containing dehydrogenase
VDAYLEPGVTEADVDRWVQSASILHSNGDALDIAIKDGRIVGVRGRAVDRINHGRLDPKDLFGWQANASPDRLTTPLVREGDRLVESDWDTAMGRIVDRSRALLDGPAGWGHFGFYTSGQLFLEEYYTLSVIAKAGIGTPHMDGNTRLCTATAADALKASFGTDGQPSSYTDVDHCDALALWGHNVAETQTVLWMRMLDRRHGRDPPALLVVDPRTTPPAREADLHLAVRSGTNQALMNGIIHLLFAHGWIDERYVSRHTIGADQLEQVTARYRAERVAEIRDVPVSHVEAAAPLVGTCDRLLSSALQVGREDGGIHQRRPHRPHLRQGDRPAGRGAARPRHLPRLRPAHGLSRQGRRAAHPLARPGVGFRGVEGMLQGTAMRLLRHHLPTPP